MSVVYITTIHHSLGNNFLPKLVNWPASMILMLAVAVDDMPSTHFTTVPFSPLLTGLTVILDTSGELF